MFRKFYSFILLCAISSTLFSQASQIVRPLEFISQLQDVYVDEAGLGWAGGTCGVLLNTTNGGLDWNQVVSPLSGNLTSVACAPTGCQATIILSGTNGEIARSTDNGTTWSLDVDPDRPTIDRLDFRTDEVVIAQYGGSSILRSEDGGISFSQIDFETFQSATIDYPTTSRGYFFDNDDRLWKTQDIGATWDSVGYTHPTGIRNISFFSGSQGFLHDQTGDLYSTSDAGETWTLVNDSDLPFNLTLMVALNSNDVRAVQVTDRVYESNDGGATWTSYSIDLGDGVFVKRNFHQQDEAFYLVSNMSEIYYSAADFQNWESQISADRIDINDIVFTDDETGFLVEGNGGILKTTDAGISWAPVQQFTINSSRELHRLPNGDLLLITNGSMPTQVSSDDGETFTDFLPQDIQVQMNFPPLSYATTQGGRMYLMGSQEAVYSDDGGTSWTVVSFPDFLVNPYNDVYFFNDNLGFVADNGGGKIGRTTDGGLTWTDLTDVSPTTQPLQTFYFSDEMNGIVFNATRGYRTSDGGDTWTNDNSIPGSSEYQVDEEGVIYTATFESGNNGAVYYSADNGFNWFEFGYNCSAYRSAAITPNGQYFFASGDGGTVVRYDLTDVVSSVDEAVGTTIERLQLSPNPARDLVTLQLETAVTSPRSVSLYDLHGRLLLERSLEIGQSSLELAVNDMPAGLYLVAMTNMQGVLLASERLVIK